MGLDLSLTLRKKDDCRYEKDICYGRKTWSIWYFFSNKFSNPNNQDEIQLLSLVDIYSFMSIVKPKIKALNKLCKAERFLFNNDKKYNELIEWLYCNFESTSLGYDWDAGFIIEWYKKLDKFLKNKKYVRNGKLNDNYYLMLCASY